MFYAPFLTDADIGGVPGKTAFVDRPGPHGMIIVLAGEKEREALMSESQSLVDEVERQDRFEVTVPLVGASASPEDASPRRADRC